MQAVVQEAELFPGQSISGSLGMDPGQMEAFVGIDIPDPGNTGLIQEERLDCRLSGLQAGDEIIFGYLQGFWSQLSKKGPGHQFIPVHEPQIAEFALVLKGQGTSVIEMKYAPGVGAELIFGRRKKDEFAGHL